jgi:hypothetical protein
MLSYEAQGFHPLWQIFLMFAGNILISCRQVGIPENLFDGVETFG